MGRRLTEADMLMAALAFGRQGGLRRQEQLTAQERSAIARTGAKARWTKARKARGPG